MPRKKEGRAARLAALEGTENNENNDEENNENNDNAATSTPMDSESQLRENIGLTSDNGAQELVHGEETVGASRLQDTMVGQ